MQGQQRYHHLLTGYLIFETVLIVYGMAVDILLAPVTEIFWIFYRHKNLDYF